MITEVPLFSPVDVDDAKWRNNCVIKVANREGQDKQVSEGIRKRKKR